MKTVSFRFYPSFACKAGRCRHTCCQGWEIDIDGESYACYRKIGGPFGDRLRAAIEEDAEGAHFRTDAEERCPFLRRDGLCDLILNLGEDSLCEICREHPRFFHWLSDRTEVGLGLCCEEAARLMLTQTEKAELTVLEDDGGAERPDAWELTVREARQAAFARIQDRRLPLQRRLEALLAGRSRPFPQATAGEWYDRLYALERMDGAWDDCLLRLKADPSPLPLEKEAETALEQFGVYLLFRHLTPAEGEEDLKARLGFCVFGVKLLARLYTAGERTMEDLLELARLFSSEIEYSEENTEALLRRF